MKVNKSAYKNRVVRDLHYLISSKYLIDNYPAVSLPNHEFTKLLNSELEDICLCVDSNNKLLARLEQARSLRLGIYCEKLMAVFFEIHSKIEVLEKNWQINRNGITVGEIDFILKIEKKLIGIEMAFKCYAQFENGLNGWKGPRQKDSFYEKLVKVRDHQLPLFSSEEVQLKYGEVEASFFVKGHLFTQNLFTNDSNVKEPEFSYIAWKDVLDLVKTDQEYYFFPKSEWVSGLYFSNKEFMINSKRIDEEIQAKKMSGKSYILGVRSKNVFQNYLIVD